MSTSKYLSIVTWNVWFDTFERLARYGAILRIIYSMRPDVVCFQEVTPFFVRLLKKSPLPSLYSISDDLTGSSTVPYGTLTMVKNTHHASFRFVDFPSRMHRRLLTAEIPHPNGNIIIGNVHLESLSNRPTREAQLEVCRETLSPYPFYILVGDFNFCSYRNFDANDKNIENDNLNRILPNHKDMWLELHNPREDPGYTFDGTQNSLVPKKQEIMRYDRIVYCNNNSVNPWIAQSINILGNNPIEEDEPAQTGKSNVGSPVARKKTFRVLLGSEVVDLFPSDHYGLFGRFKY